MATEGEVYLQQRLEEQHRQMQAMAQQFAQQFQQMQRQLQQGAGRWRRQEVGRVGEVPEHQDFRRRTENLMSLRLSFAGNARVTKVMKTVETDCM